MTKVCQFCQFSSNVMTQCYFSNVTALCNLTNCMKKSSCMSFNFQTNPFFLETLNLLVVVCKVCMHTTACNWYGFDHANYYCECMKGLAMIQTIWQGPLWHRHFNVIIFKQMNGTQSVV